MVLVLTPTGDVLIRPQGADMAPTHTQCGEGTGVAGRCRVSGPADRAPVGLEGTELVAGTQCGERSVGSGRQPIIVLGILIVSANQIAVRSDCAYRLADHLHVAVGASNVC